MGVGAGLYMYVVVVQKFTFAISSPDEFLLRYLNGQTDKQTYRHAHRNTSHLCMHVKKLECGPMPDVMAALPTIGGALCSTPQRLADAHY